MHDELFRNQPEWNGEATDNPKKIFLGYVKSLGMNTDTWEKCFDSQAHQSRILANQAEGNRRKVQSTPTFVIGTRLIPGAMSYDVFKAYVDSAAKEAPPAAAKTDSAATSATKSRRRAHEVSRRQTLALLAVVGVCIALYLTLYKIGVIGVLSCSIGSCETVNTSKWSTLLGIPIAAWGLARTSRCCCSRWSAAARRTRQSVPIARMIVALAGWSVLFSAWLTYQELFVIHAICIWCVSSALLWVLIFALSVADLRAVSRAA